MSGKSLTGKVALITGGAFGIGRATALLFAREGASIVVADVNAKAGDQVAREVSAEGGNVLFEPADVTKAADCERVVKRAVEQFGTINVLFNNAGIIRRASVLELTEKDWDRVMDVNVKSMFLLSRQVIPVMLKSGGGSIINMSS